MTLANAGPLCIMIAIVMLLGIAGRAISPKFGP